MKKKTNFPSMFVMIIIISLVISFLNGDFEFGRYFEGLEVTDLEVLLDTLSLGLGFLAFASLLALLIFRAVNQEKDQDLSSGRDKDQPLEATWVEDQEKKS